ncbi:MAG TPA: hypothetical protein VHC22_24485 [Pirellulales bacterium]|nr:hypothetical protein [Pirellulales bacterium]
MPPITRGILFELQTALAANADKPFATLEDRVNRLQGRMSNMTLGVGPQAQATPSLASLTDAIERRMRSSPAAASPAASAPAGGSPWAAGLSRLAQQTTGWSGLSAIGRDAPEQHAQARKTEEAIAKSAKLRAEMKRKAAEDDETYMRQQAERTEKVNQQALAQQIADLKAAEAEKQKILKAADAERTRALKEQQAQEKAAARDIAAATKQQAKDDAIWRQAGFGAGGGINQTGTAGMSLPTRGDIVDPMGLGQHNQALAHARERERRENERTASEQRRHVAEVREQYSKLSESIVGSTEAVTKLAEGFGYLHLIGESDLRGLTDGLLKMRGTVLAIRGSVESLRDMGGLVRNLRDVGQQGGVGGILRSAAGLGPVTAGAVGHGGAAAGLGTVAATGVTGTGLAAAAVPTIATIAAGLAIDQLTTGGRFRSAGLRAAGTMYTRGSQMLHGMGEWFETVGTSEAARKQIEFERLHNFEDPNDPRGWRIGMGLPGLRQYYQPYNAAAAAERNTKRLGTLAERGAGLRELRFGLEEVGSEPVYRQVETESEQKRARFEIENRLASAHESRESVGFYQREQRTGVGRDSGLFAGAGDDVFSARSIVDRGERQRFLNDQRLAHLEHVAANRSLEQRRDINLEDTRGIETHLGTLSEGSPARLEAEQRLKQLAKERADITRESDQLHQRAQQQDIMAASRLLELQVQRAKSSQNKLSASVRSMESAEESLAAMNPMQIRALIGVRRKAEEGETLNHYERQLLASAPDQRSQFLARQSAREYTRQQLERAGTSSDKFFSVENLFREASQNDAARQAGKRDNMAGEISRQKVTGEITVGGSYNVNITIQHDEDLAETFGQEMGRLETEIKQRDAEIMKASRKAAEDMAQRIHQNRAATARE